MKPRDRRVMFLRVSPEKIIDRVLNLTSSLPKDVEALAASVDFDTGDIKILIRSEGFKDLTPGEKIPYY